jgi:hypothetical protein
MLKRYKPKVGDRVEVRAIPFRGRSGVLERKRRIMGLRMWDVRCDDTDLLGRKLVTVSKSGFRVVE